MMAVFRNKLNNNKKKTVLEIFFKHLKYKRLVRYLSGAFVAEKLPYGWVPTAGGFLKSYITLLTAPY